MPLAPAEIVLEDRRCVAAFLEARLQAATALPSRNARHDLVIAVQVGHRRAQRALSLVFEGTEDAQLKRSILRRYAILDRALEQVRDGLDAMPALTFLGMANSVIEAIDGSFAFAFSHIDEVRNTQPEVRDDADTRPAEPRDPEGTSTEAWFAPTVLEDGPTHPTAGHRRQTTRRGH